MRLIKIGGTLLDQQDFPTALGAALTESAEPIVIVHGGGKDVDEFQEKLQIPIRKVDGIRITDDATLEVVVMVLSGLVNKKIVAGFLAQGVQAVGLSGSDGGIVRSRPLVNDPVDLGNVGEVESVHAEILFSLLENDLVPVLSPISIGSDGELYNVNADHVAGAIAAEMGASSLDMLTEVAGVFAEGELLPNLTPQETHHLIDSGVIQGGMIPKVKTAIRALELGVKQVRILDLNSLVQGGGTTFQPQARQPLSHSEERTHGR